MVKLLRILGWHRQMNAARAIVRVIFRITDRIQAHEPQAETLSPVSPVVDNNAADEDMMDEDVMDMELDDIAAIQAFNNRFEIDVHG